MDKKRIIAIIGFTLVSLLLGGAIYFVFFAKKPATQRVPSPRTEAPGGGFPKAGEGGERSVPARPGALPSAQPGALPGAPAAGRVPIPRIQPVTTEIVKSPAADARGGAKFYSQSDGKFYRIGKDGTLAPLSDATFYNVQKVTWSRKQNESIIEYPDGANIYYNFDTKKQVTLPKHWENFSFAASGDAIAAKSIGLSPENRWLVIASPDGSDVRLIEPLGDNADKVDVDWSPNKTVVAFSRTGEPLGADRQEVLLIGQNGENFTSLEVEGRGLKTQWSPEGNRLLYSVYSARSDFRPELWIVNSEGNAIGSGRDFLNLNTWADKCTFADDRSIYCGVPRALSAGAGFSPSLANDTPDYIVKIDIVSGARSEIKTDESYIISNMFVSADGKTLYFTDKRKPGLFQAAL